MNEFIQNSGLKNWIKACIGLRCVRDGMFPFIEKKCHDLYLSNQTYTIQFCQVANYSCTSCSVKKLRPSHSEDECPIKSAKIRCGCKPSANTQTCKNLGSCGVLYDLILNQHVNKAPRWDNSNCSKWYNNGWEQMKCFIDTPGYSEKGHLSQADITAFVHICQNNTTLKDLFRTEIDKLIQVRNDRNEIFHSGEMDISDDKLKEYIAHMRDALRISVFNKLPDIQTCLDMLTKLETDINIEIDTNQEMIARKDALNALIERSKTLQEENTNSAKDAKEIKRQVARLAVLQDDHMKYIKKNMKTIKRHMQSIKEEYNKSAEVLLQHSNDLKNITSAIVQHTPRLEKLHRELVTQTEIIRGIETITMGIGRIVTQNYRMISEIGPGINTILLTVEKLYQIIQDTANIQGKIVLEISGIANKAELTHEIVQRWSNSKNKPGLDDPDEMGHCLSETEGELEKEGITVNCVQDGSVEICFQCSSIPNWIKLCEKCIDGSMAEIFWRLEHHLKSKDGFENLQIAVDMYETDFVESVEAIVKQLHPKLISNFPNFVKSECYSDPTQIKWDDVLRLVLEHERSREPASQIPDEDKTKWSTDADNDSGHPSVNNLSPNNPDESVEYSAAARESAKKLLDADISFSLLLRNVDNTEQPGYSVERLNENSNVNFNNLLDDDSLFSGSATSTTSSQLSEVNNLKMGMNMPTSKSSLPSKENNTASGGGRTEKTSPVSASSKPEKASLDIDSPVYDSRSTHLHISEMASDITPTASNSLEQHKMVQTIAAIELYHAQREVANYLELAYLNLADHPDVAREVRMTAHAARSKHLLTSGLMKTFTVTAVHIIKTLIPMILDAVELKDRDIIIDAFGQIIQNAEAMKKESENTRSSYLTLQTEVQNNMASVNKRNKHVIQESERLKVEMEREAQMVKAAALAQKELEEEKKRMEDDLESLKGQRDRMFQVAEGAGRDMSVDDDTTFLDSSILPSAAMGGGIAGVVIDVVGKAANLFTSMFKGNMKKDRYKELMKGYQAAEDTVYRAQKERRGVVERMNEQRKEAHQRLAKIKELSMQADGLGNVESLREASLHLGDVDRQFTRIIQFWENMAAILKYMKEDVRSGEPYLKKIEDERYAQRFKKSISRAEKDWQFFGKICSDYVQESDTEIMHLYNFLSSPIDHMSNSDRTARQKALISSIESDIDSAFGEAH